MIRRLIFDWPDPPVAEGDRDLAMRAPRRLARKVISIWKT